MSDEEHTPDASEDASAASAASASSASSTTSTTSAASAASAASAESTEAAAAEPGKEASTATSTASTASAASTSQLKEQLQELLRLAGNGKCADCSEADPQWASSNLGVFLCITCSGIHRNLGVHISRVKSLFLDNWKPEEFHVMQRTGNLLANSTWEATCTLPCVKAVASDSTQFKEQWIRAKYERKLYAAPAPADKDKDKEAATSSATSATSSTSSASSSARTTSTGHGLPRRDGLLVKMGAVRKSWKKRWFELEGSVLGYYKKKDGEPQGYVCLADVVGSIDCVAEGIEKYPFCFAIPLAGRTYLINADSAIDMYDWIQALRAARYLLCAPVPAAPAAPAASSSSSSSSATTSAPAAAASSAAGEATHLHLHAHSERTAEDVAADELTAAARLLHGELRAKMHKAGGKPHANSVFAANIVDHLMRAVPVRARSEAVLLAAQLSKLSIVKPCVAADKFTDGLALYTLAEVPAAPVQTSSDAKAAGTAGAGDEGDKNDGDKNEDNEKHNDKEAETQSTSGDAGAAEST